MIDYYVKEDLEKARAQRKKTLLAYFIVLGVVVLISAGFITWYLTLPYKSPTILTIKLIHYSILAVFAIFSFIYLGIKYKRINRYYKLVNYLETGLRETSTGSFFEYDETSQEKDGVDFKSLVFLEWNKYKNDFFERKVLVFEEKPFPKFNENDNVRYITQSNVLISYEILS